MATTAEPTPTNQPTRPTTAKGWGADAPRPAATSDGVRTPRAAARMTSPSRSPMPVSAIPTSTLRATTGAAPLSGDPRPRDRRHRHRGRQRRYPPPRGDTVAVGCMVDSCMECDHCLEGWEVSAARAASRPTTAPTITTARSPRAATPTISSSRDHFVLQGPRRHGRQPGRAFAVRRDHDLFAAAPVQCRPGTKMAVVGLGGLGHMGVKLGAAMGAHVTMITTTPSKGEDARELGAHDVIISTDRSRWKRRRRASTSSSTPSRSATRSTAICSCSAGRGAWSSSAR